MLEVKKQNWMPSTQTPESMFLATFKRISHYLSSCVSPTTPSPSSSSSSSFLAVFLLTWAQGGQESSILCHQPSNAEQQWVFSGLADNVSKNKMNSNDFKF